MPTTNPLKLGITGRISLWGPTKGTKKACRWRVKGFTLTLGAAAVKI